MQANKLPFHFPLDKTKRQEVKGDERGTEILCPFLIFYLFLYFPSELEKKLKKSLSDKHFFKESRSFA
jgi:hypothetical protein